MHHVLERKEETMPVGVNFNEKQEAKYYTGLPNTMCSFVHACNLSFLRSCNHPPFSQVFLHACMHALTPSLPK